MAMRPFIAAALLLVHAAYVIVQGASSGCRIPMRCGGGLDWLNASTLSEDTIRCVKELEQAQDDLDFIHGLLEKSRSVLNDRRHARGEPAIPSPSASGEQKLRKRLHICYVPKPCDGVASWDQLFLHDPVERIAKSRCLHEIEKIRDQHNHAKDEYDRLQQEFQKSVRQIEKPTDPSKSYGDATTSQGARTSSEEMRMTQTKNQEGRTTEGKSRSHGLTNAQASCFD